MANRRMFSKTITNSSNFLMMPLSSQGLYFHLGMNADDDGFCEHFAIMRMVEAKPDDLKILQAKGLVKVFDDRVLIVKDWKENNYLRSDRYTPSKYLKTYKDELKRLTPGTPNGNQRLPQVRLGKDRLGKVKKRIYKDKKLTPFQEMKLLTSKNLTEDQQKLRQQVLKKLTFPYKNYPTTQLKAFLWGDGKHIGFISYWSELTKNGKQMKWQTCNTFQPSLRLATWVRNQANWDK